jgi:hypothetical protein
MYLVLSPNGGLKRLSYPFKKKASTEEPEKEEDREETDAATWPTFISFKIPPELYISPENAQVMFFNGETNTWEQDSINDIDINVEKGEVKFRTTHFQPTAVVQHSYLEFPYRMFSLTLIFRGLADRNSRAKPSDCYHSREAARDSNRGV